MSSATSTDAHEPRQARDSLQPWQLFTLAGLAGATVAVFMARGQTPEGVILLSAIVFAAAAVGLAALRTFAPFGERARDLADDAPPPASRSRAALEREKLMVLRSIKEIEFDRAMGKMSEKDFAEMSARLRARAARLMRTLDAGAGYREAIEREIAARLERAAGPSAPPRQLPGARVCAACGTHNDADARFCKGCGGRLEAQP